MRFLHVWASRPIGFVNPVPYAHPEVLHDIISRRGVTRNPACGTDGFAVSQGVGWDPVMWLGTPNYPDLVKLFMEQP
ncbi:uncharacterized protein ACLA_083980 [Aspergillus clavatus NRRL 1]|uniref:Uncharacterized protein n=1 Tax=Aspergillus clavatus (strain ATCC 1007 / CBS 513.65 / DSM 816 / NCTC 3887 / NRRL 1 / QM 1276 / 107) TaxID=344612 RepID=A1CTR6_ASPCL|nr:uncharacterized protein ACLA_083980 [Aspergillus clavatus NRRL 1]EAW06703.1 hypothetical protein ACLA_083980 [Aspergillus clavatus NRRL 1]